MSIGQLVNLAARPMSENIRMLQDSLGRSNATKTPNFQFNASKGHVDSFSGVDMSKVPQQHRDTVSAQLLAAGNACQNMEKAIEQAKGEGNFQKVADLEGKLGQLNKALAEMVYEIEHADPAKFASIASVFGVGVGVTVDMCSRQFANVGDINREYDQFIKLAAGMPETGISAPASSPPPMPESITSSKADGAGASGGVKPEAKTEGAGASGGVQTETKTEKTDGAGASGGVQNEAKTDGAKGGEEAGKTGGSGKTGEAPQMGGLKEYFADPQGYMDKMSELDPQQFSAQMFVLQQQLNQLNQATSMMTNMMKAEHDTKKAIINNMRV